ncbi:MAG: sporulation integral membrane protein YtvI [Oscillospiraceae bacterium]|nr:sporulation integral membrane protein YtvI [Oscillospiraceae bacterium]
MTERLRSLNDKSNDLLRRTAIVLAVLAVIAILVFLFPYVAPFIVAILIAALIEPVVKLVAKAFPKLRFARTVASAICTIIVLAILLVVSLTVMARVLSELRLAAMTLPKSVSQWVADATTWVKVNLDNVEMLDDAIRTYIEDLITTLGRSATQFATTSATTVVRGVWNTATVTVPQILLFITITFMSIFYFSADRIRIFSFLQNLVPHVMRENGRLVKANLFRGVFSQIRASLIMLVITFAELSLGFISIRMDYAVLLALIISLFDALPIVGAGLFLLPLSIYGFFTNNILHGVGLLLIYLVIGIVRQTVEPRIIGKNIGLHPLATMLAMYISYKLIGLSGMLLGPIVMSLCKIVVELSALPAIPTVVSEVAQSAQPKPAKDVKNVVLKTKSKKRG